MRFVPAARGEHLHVQPRKGRMTRKDAVQGYPIVGYEFDDGRFQGTYLLVAGKRVLLTEFLASLPPTVHAETIPFPSFKGCCEMRYGEG